MASTKTSPHVLIIGAGLGGMTLAQVLRRQGITFEIFERDASNHSRFQGWCIALHQAVGELKRSLPEDLGDVESVSHLLPLELPAQVVVYDDGKPLLTTANTKETPLLRANRTRLREYLARNLDVKWGVNFTKIEERGDKVVVHFDDGSSATGDVLVGADGTNSKVRHHLFDGKAPAKNVPMARVICNVRLRRAQYERQLQLAHSAYIAFSNTNRHRLFVGLNRIDPDEKHADYYWFDTWADPAMEGSDSFWTDTASKQEMYDYAIKHLANLPPELTEILRLSKPEDLSNSPSRIKDIDLGGKMPNRRVTLLGDAAHAMSPARGEGGNHAIQDALNLGRILPKSTPENILANLLEYQNEMLARGGEAQRRSRAAVSDDGADSKQGLRSWVPQAKASAE